MLMAKVVQKGKTDRTRSIASTRKVAGTGKPGGRAAEKAQHGARKRAAKPPTRKVKPPKKHEKEATKRKAPEKILPAVSLESKSVGELTGEALQMKGSEFKKVTEELEKRAVKETEAESALKELAEKVKPAQRGIVRKALENVEAARKTEAEERKKKRIIARLMVKINELKLRAVEKAWKWREKLRARIEEIRKARQEAKARKLEAARKREGEKTRQEAEKKARIDAEARERARTKEEERKKCEEERARKEARKKAEREAKSKAREELKVKRAEEKRVRKAAEEKAIEEKKRTAEAEKKAREQAEAKAREEKKRREEAEKKAREETRRKAESERKSRAEAEARSRDEARWIAEENRKREEEAGRKAEAERKRKAIAARGETEIVKQISRQLSAEHLAMLEKITGVTEVAVLERALGITKTEKQVTAFRIMDAREAGARLRELLHAQYEQEHAASNGSDFHNYVSSYSRAVELAALFGFEIRTNGDASALTSQQKAIIAHCTGLGFSNRDRVTESDVAKFMHMSIKQRTSLFETMLHGISTKGGTAARKEAKKARYRLEMHDLELLLDPNSINEEWRESDFYRRTERMNGVSVLHVISAKKERAKSGEDHFFTRELTVKGRRVQVDAVFDGMGGHAGGEKASEIAVEILTAEVDKPGFNPENFGQVMTGAHARIAEISRSSPRYKGMGTTAVVAVSTDAGQTIYHSGDSRAYLLSRSDGKLALHQLTIDHSLVEQMIAKGTLDRKNAKNHDHRNVIDHALGYPADGKAQFEKTPVAAKKGSVLLLCSDGFSDVVFDEEIVDILASSPDIIVAGERLFRLARSRVEGELHDVTVRGEQKQIQGKNDDFTLMLRVL